MMMGFLALGILAAAGGAWLYMQASAQKKAMRPSPSKGPAKRAKPASGSSNGSHGSDDLRGPKRPKAEFGRRRQSLS
jgi:hypothetical protein